MSTKVYWDQIRKSIQSCSQLHEARSAVGYTRGCHVCLPTNKTLCAVWNLFRFLFLFFEKKKEKNNAVRQNTVCIRRRRRDIRKCTSVPTFLQGDPPSLSSFNGSITPRMAETLPPSTPAPLTAQCLQNSLPRDGTQERMSQG